MMLFSMNHLKLKLIISYLIESLILISLTSSFSQFAFIHKDLYSFSNGAELDWDKYLDWNEKNQAIETEIAENSSNSSSEFEQRHRKKRRKIKRKSKKEVSQLFRITSKIAEFLPSLKTEKTKQK